VDAAVQGMLERVDALKAALVLACATGVYSDISRLVIGAVERSLSTYLDVLAPGKALPFR
jgi:hypothetical protein